MSNLIKNRYEFIYLFDVENGNPNGDPDSGNMPRVDPETSFGIITDVCLKRKIRNYVDIIKKNESPYRIYVRERAILNRLHDEARKAVGVKIEGDNKKRKGSGDEVIRARLWMCKNFYDVRTFGAVMSLGSDCGQVRGPIQFNFARSIDLIVPLEISITRMAVATEKEAVAQGGDNRTMGRKHIVPYGLYRMEGYVSAFLGQQTGFSEDDLNLLWQALINMFEHDHSAARGKMNARKLVVFKHDSELGNAPAHKLFDMIKVQRTGDLSKPVRAYTDYKVEISASCPQGVSIEEKL